VTFGLPRLVVRRARQERLLQAAGSLAFTTTLALVPLLAVGFALFERFPLVFGRVEAALDAYLLRGWLPPEIARPALGHLHRFAANAGALTALGSALLLVTALALLFTVDSTLNRLWNVKRARPLARRIGLYLALLLAGPPLLGLTLWAMSALIGASLGLIGPLPASTASVLQLGPAALAWAALALLYRGVPNTHVPWASALAGGLVGSVALELGKRGFAAYLVKLPTYKALYGAFAVLPLFLLWLWFSWLVTLGAALIAANLGRSTDGAARRR
jgi:membrane protein